MSLADLIAAQAPTPRRTKLDVIREVLSPEDRRTLDASLADPRIEASAIAAALRAQGFSISDSTAAKARREGR